MVDPQISDTKALMKFFQDQLKNHSEKDEQIALAEVCISHPDVIKNMRISATANVNYDEVCKKYSMRDDSSLRDKQIPDNEKRVYAHDATAKGELAKPGYKGVGNPIFAKFKAASDEMVSANEKLKKSIQTAIKAKYANKPDDDINTLTDSAYNILITPLEDKSEPFIKLLNNKMSQLAPKLPKGVELSGQSTEGTLLAVLAENQPPMTSGKSTPAIKNLKI